MSSKLIIVNENEVIIIVADYLHQLTDGTGI